MGWRFQIHPHSRDFDSQNDLGYVCPLLIMGIFKALSFSWAHNAAVILRWIKGHCLAHCLGSDNDPGSMAREGKKLNQLCNESWR